ncbi:HPC2 multi-domain protein [Streptomyces amakusaensis]|uniref:HPC2 multi-domain protein n=1 Tax=Streptomyces amakusaensis TaxID=67271 RepID=A0ABW0ASH5_9ACTN
MAPPKTHAPRPGAAATLPAVPGNRAGVRTPAPRPRFPLSNAAATAAALAGGTGAGQAAAPPAGRSSLPAQNTVGNGAVAAARSGTAAKPAAPARAAADATAGTASAAGAAEAPARAGAATAAGAAGAGGRRRGPESDPKFGALKKEVHRKKRSVATSHRPAHTEAAAASAAALPPKDDAEAQGKTANAERMNEARPGEFDKAAFIRAVEKAIADRAPKNLDEADKFAGSGKAEEVRAEVQGQVGAGKTESAEQIATTTAAAPDTSAAVPKTVVPLAADRPPGAPGAPDARNAVPDRLPASATDMSAGPERVDRHMADAKVTETQLRRAHEPAFTKALSGKKAAEQHSAAAPGRLRGHEAGELRAATDRAGRLGGAAMGAMGAGRALTGQRVDVGKTGAKGRDEEKRARVTAVLQGVFDTMKTEVEGILGGLDKLVDDRFAQGEKEAREAFTAEHRRKMDEYKDRRYSGLDGAWRWVRDLFAGLPAEADKIFEQARDGYLRRMRQVIADVATVIAGELNRAKLRIARGRAEIQDAVRKLPADLRSIGRQAAAEFSDAFAELSQSVDDKGTELVDTLAAKYTEALKAVDDEIAAEREKNKGLVAKAIDAVKGVIDTILELKRLLLAVLAKAAQAVMMILTDPIGFLRNLVSAVGAGLRQFLKNIGTHLRQGIMSWLLGRAAEAGIQIPAAFDVRGVLTMLASLLGLTWPAIRARIVRRVPERAVAVAETAVPLVAEVRKRGVAGMWEDLKTRVGDLRRNLLDNIIGYVTPAIVTAGITWILSLLNPASAFVRAVKLIIDIVTFVVTQARQIIDFVNAVLDAVIAIAKGGSGGVPSLVERALARSIPTLLGFLAALLGLGGIAARVKQIIQAMARPVNKAVDWVIDKIIGLVKKVWARWTRSRGTGKGKGKGKGKDGRSGDSPEKKKEQLAKALKAAVDTVNKYRGRPVAGRILRPLLTVVRVRHGLAELRLFENGENWAVYGRINPSDKADTEAKTEAKITGMLAAYRGIHFKLTWDPKAYQEILKQNLVGRPTFSAAAMRMTGSTKPDGSDVPESTLLEKAQIVVTMIEKTKSPTSVMQWWPGKLKMQFESEYFGLLQRYINSYNKFSQEVKNPKIGGKLMDVPFISTSKKAIHSARYAKGEKFAEAHEKRSDGIVGRLFVYLFSVADIQKQDPANISQLAGNKIKLRARLIHEGEATFSGVIPGKNLVAQHDATAAETVQQLAEKGEQDARGKAEPQGGLKEWS